MSLKPNRHYLMEQTLCNIGLPWAQRELLIIIPRSQLEPLNHLQQSQLWPTQEQKSVTRFCLIGYQLQHLNHANISQPTLDRWFPSWGCGVELGVKKRDQRIGSMVLLSGHLTQPAVIFP